MPPLRSACWPQAAATVGALAPLGAACGRNRPWSASLCKACGWPRRETAARLNGAPSASTWVVQMSRVSSSEPCLDRPTVAEAAPAACNTASRESTKGRPEKGRDGRSWLMERASGGGERPMGASAALGRRGLPRTAGTTPSRRGPQRARFLFALQPVPGIHYSRGDPRSRRSWRARPPGYRVADRPGRCSKKEGPSTPDGGIRAWRKRPQRDWPRPRQATWPPRRQ